MTNESVLSGRLLNITGNGCAHCSNSRISMREAAISCVAVSDGSATDSLWMPPIANAHDHIRGIKPMSLGAFDLPLELWLTSMTNIPKVDPYLVAANALGRQAIGGVSTVMIHYTRPNDPARVVDELEVVARAATDIGVRVAIAVSMRDRNPIGYGSNEAILDGLERADRDLIKEKLIPDFRCASDQIKAVDELAARIDSPLVTVQYGPYGVEWCSRELLEAIASASADTNRRVHMHLLESEIQREYLDVEYPQGPVHFLDELGLLTERLSVAHATWLRPDEMDLLAERGVTVSTNLSSNLSLRNGIPPVRDMARRGVDLAVGLDGFSFDDDDDAFRELRLNYLLHKGVGMEEGLTQEALLRAACYNGRRSVTGLPSSDELLPGAPADLMELDYGQLSKDLWVDVDEVGVIIHRATARSMKRMIVAGETVVSDGKLARVNLDDLQAEMAAQIQHQIPAFESWREVSSKLGGQLRKFYQSGMHRCG